MSDLKLLQERFPFLSLFKYAGAEHIGLIQNKGKTIVSVYVYDDIVEHAKKVKFLELAEIWWWESNRKIPINLFLKQDFDEFKFCLKNFNVKEFDLIQGHIVSLKDLNDRRIKRRRIELVRTDTQ